MSSQNAPERFKTNFLSMLDELIELMKPKPQVEASLMALKQITMDTPALFLIEGFLYHVDAPSTDPKNNRTLREEFERGNYFKVLASFLTKMNMSESLQLAKEIDLDNLTDEDKDLYVDYLKSYFRVSQNYRET